MFWDGRILKKKIVCCALVYKESSYVHKKKFRLEFKFSYI